MFTVYVLKSLSAGKSYVGVTDNLQRRLMEHNSGKHAYTRRYKPWIVIHTETFETFASARWCEKNLKSASGRRFLKQLFQKKNM